MFKTRKSRIIVKISIVTLVIMFAAYVICWFAAAEILKKKFQVTEHQAGNWSISFAKAKVGGFPFKLNVELTDTKIAYNNNLVNIKANFEFNTLKAETGPLFTYINFTMPVHFSSDLQIGPETVAFAVNTEKEHFLKITEASLINTYKVFQLFSNAENAIDGLRISNIFYQANGSHLIDKKSDTEVLSSDSYANLSIDSNSDGLVSVKYTSDTKSEFKSNPLNKHNFHKLDSKLNIALKLKPIENNYLSILALDVNPIDLQLDQSGMTFTGNAKQKGEDIKLDMNLKLTKWDMLVQELQTQNLITQEKRDILDNLMREVTGLEKTTDADIKIYSQDGLIKIGNSNIYTVNAYITSLFTKN